MVVEIDFHMYAEQSTEWRDLFVQSIPDARQTLFIHVDSSFQSREKSLYLYVNPKIRIDVLNTCSYTCKRLCE